MKKINRRKRDTSKSLIQDGERYFKAGKFEDALECFENDKQRLAIKKESTKKTKPDRLNCFKESKLT